MNLAGLSLRDLEYVVAVEEERHFGRAARRCSVTQPALSAQLRKLEESLGVALFERTSRRVLPTAIGLAVTRHARRVLAEAEALLETARRGQAGGLRGRFALAAIQTLGPYLFPLVLKPLRDALPDLALILSEGRTQEILDHLREGRVDAALLSPPFDEAGFVRLPLFSEPFLLACPAGHPLAKAAEVAGDDLAGPDLLLLDEGNCLREQAIAACGAANAGRHATSLETLRSMVAAGAGYTILPRLAAHEDRDRNSLLVYRQFEGRVARRTIVLVYRSSDQRVQEFHALAEVLRELAPAGTQAMRAEAVTS